MVLGAALALVCLPLSGAPRVAALPLLAAALAAAPVAPIYALFLAGFAANKVQGFALSKAVGVVFVAVVAGYLVAPPWQFAFGIVPQFWPAKLYWLLVEGGGNGWPAGATFVFLGGLSYQLGVLWLLLRRFDRVTHR